MNESIIFDKVLRVTYFKRKPQSELKHSVWEEERKPGPEPGL
jgi:hypothetical protein